MPSLTFGDVRVETSNLDKVLYPQTGTTKGQVIDYYVEIAPAMIPHMAGRPVTRKRWPNGVKSTPFFEKNLAAHAPEWIERKAMHHRSRTIVYPVIDTVAGLAWLGQQASLEVHVPQWRFVRTAENTVGTEGDDEMGPATRLVFDLDPGDGVSLADCAEVAIAVRDMVAQIDLVAFAVTSGSKGIHVYVPLDRTLGPGGASTVAKQVAGNLETLYPEPGDLHDGEGRARGQGVSGLEPEQPGQDHHRAVLDARPRRTDGRRAAHVGRVGTSRRATATAVRGGARALPRDRGHARRPRSRRRQARQVPVDAQPDENPGTGAGVAAAAQRRQRLRHPRTPRPAAALGRAPRTRRGAGVLGGAEGRARDHHREPARRAHRGPPDRVPHVRGDHPEGTVRRRHHDDLGHRHLRDREVARRRGDHPAARRQGGGTLRADPDRRQELADAPHEGSDRSGFDSGNIYSARSPFPARSRADARHPGRRVPPRCRTLGLRGQVGRLPAARRDRPRRDAAAQPRRKRRHRSLSPVVLARRRSRRSPGSDRRRGGGVRRGWHRQLRFAADRWNQPGRPVSRVRCAVPGRNVVAAQEVHRPPPAVGGVGLDHAVAAGATAARRRRAGGVGGEPRTRPRGCGRQTARLGVSARQARPGVGQGEELEHPGGGDRRLETRAGRPARTDRLAVGGHPRRGRVVALRR